MFGFCYWLRNSALPLSERSLWITPFISSEPLSEGTDIGSLEEVRISHVIEFLFHYWFFPQFPPPPSHFTIKEEEIKLYFQLCIWKSPRLNIQVDLPEVRLSTSSTTVLPGCLPPLYSLLKIGLILPSRNSREEISSASSCIQTFLRGDL